MTITRYFVSMTWMNTADHIAVEKDSPFYETGIGIWNLALIRQVSQFEICGVQVTVHSYVSTHSPCLSRYFMVEGENESIDRWAKRNGFTIEENDEENRP